MTSRLVIKSPQATLTLESDNSTTIEILSVFCKNELGAWHSTDDIDELTIKKLSGEQSDKLYSLIFELGLL